MGFREILGTALFLAAAYVSSPLWLKTPAALEAGRKNVAAAVDRNIPVLEERIRNYVESRGGKRYLSNKDYQEDNWRLQRIDGTTYLTVDRGRTLDISTDRNSDGKVDYIKRKIDDNGDSRYDRTLDIEVNPEFGRQKDPFATEAYNTNQEDYYNARKRAAETGKTF